MCTLTYCFRSTCRGLGSGYVLHGGSPKRLAPPRNTTYVAMCGIIVSFTRGHRDGVWFGFVRFAMVLAVVLCWVERCFSS